ncbi:beta-fructofuranosidase, soluble isoenzyme I-like isoform X2 [Mercurialis annua]|uniref:beta-fructofuranosidase, soluble isoenzyme I-like isoform X2 n=1 Tax=Mercurialis annua TaxID=3986 RepID=UPI00215E0267|nr:beta-fructofuranosidase, soluble isoenzyme I-like isoform X2 [Mercurialis annua]
MDSSSIAATSSENTLHAPYAPLPEQPNSHHEPSTKVRRPLKIFSVVFLLSLLALIVKQSQQPSPQPNKNQSAAQSAAVPVPRGVAEGVSAKSSPSYLNDGLSYNWTNAMFSWQKTSYHFQPENHWMNGPLFHMGWYHLFYQYNFDSAVWGLIRWGHAVSRDLIHWLYLPLAMVPDQWYDINGVWTGSATFLPDGQIVMLYTGDTNTSLQVQNLAYPANLSDPLLIDWVKYPGNPVLFPPPGIGFDKFRDPTTAWMGPDGKWRLTIGSRINETIGISLMYKTTNFITYELLDGLLHSVEGTGMWECVDFYPVALNGSNGLDTSANGPGIKHVLKASLDNTKVDYYAIGTYDPVRDKWTPDNPEEDVGIGLRVDYGRYYASKSFYDQNKQRRILWGWINETDTEQDDLQKGWASVQTIPRTIVFDSKTGANLLHWPVEEIESLRLKSTEFEQIVIAPGSVIPLDIGSASQLDIFAEFETELISESTGEEYGCGGGAVARSSLGPFGLLVLADDSLSELTPVFFRPESSTDGTLKTYFCADETRSSKADVFKQVYGSTVPVLENENLKMRILVDHSIVESFAQGGRTVITSRIYPTEAIYGAAKVFLFNNATSVNVKATLKIWELNSAFISPFPFGEY